MTGGTAKERTRDRNQMTEDVRRAFEEAFTERLGRTCRVRTTSREDVNPGELFLVDAGDDFRPLYYTIQRRVATWERALDLGMTVVRIVAEHESENTTYRKLLWDEDDGALGRYYATVFTTGDGGPVDDDAPGGLPGLVGERARAAPAPEPNVILGFHIVDLRRLRKVRARLGPADATSVLEDRLVRSPWGLVRPPFSGPGRPPEMATRAAWIYTQKVAAVLDPGVTFYRTFKARNARAGRSLLAHAGVS